MRFVALLILAGLCSACKPSGQAPSESELKEQNAVMSFALQHFQDNNDIAGAVTLVVSPNGILGFEAFGLADIGAKRPMRQDSMFWIASMTKPITAMGVMMLVEEGKVKLDDHRARSPDAYQWHQHRRRHSGRPAD
ncbi:MAG: class A beta-lactamase-related serine hydrolase [Verrucomicrobia bacterium]|nr:class A beta-lactamase-related serine hydrolase [Verrucomicrobiota bacterium]